MSLQRDPLGTGGRYNRAMRNGVYTTAIAPGDRRAVDSLVEKCRVDDGLEMPIHRFPDSNHETNQFLYFEAGELVGVATLPPGPEIEVLGVVRPDSRMRGIGRSLLVAVEAECRSRNADGYLLVCEAASKSGCEFADRLGGTCEFSEHLMEFDWDAGTKLLEAEVIELEAAGSQDVEDLVHVRRDQNQNVDQSRRVIEEWLRSEAHELLVVRRESHAVGMIRVTRTRNEVWLNSFAIDESCRGKGLGRLMLANVVRNHDQSRRILLEVETDNEPALGLYRSAGFRERTTYRYYRLTLPEIRDGQS